MKNKFEIAFDILGYLGKILRKLAAEILLFIFNVNNDLQKLLILFELVDL